MELIYPMEPAPVLPRATYLNPGYRIAKGEEMVPVVSEKGLVVGQAARSYVHGGARLLHPVVHLHILNREGKLYLQKRSMKKDLLPGYWDTAVGGHIGYGELLYEALYREAGEELGMLEFNPTFIKSYVNENEYERELVNVFACVGNFTPRPDHDEVSEGRYWTYDEIEASIGQGILTPNFEAEFGQIKDSLTALL